MPIKRTVESYLTQFNISKEYLRDAYINRQLSLPDIRREKGIGLKACASLLRHFLIPVRTISQSRTTTIHKKRFVDLFKKSYGVENPSQIDWVKEKKKSTFLNHYGVDNIWKSKKYYVWLNNYMLKNYGVKRFACDDFVNGNISKKWWATASDEVRENKIKQQLRNLHKASSHKNTIELKVAAALDLLSIPYKRYHFVGRYIADFYVKKLNIIIECNGDFWHANPTKYQSEDVISFPRKKVTAESLWKKDKLKLDKYKNLGYNITVLWETDIKRKDKDGTLPEFLMECFNENKSKSS